MRYIQDLSPETQRLLERIYQESTRSQVRARAHCILLSFRGFTIAQLMEIFGVSRRTIHYWFQKWDTLKLVGLYDRAGRGRKPKLSPDQKQQVKDWVKSEPKSLNKVINKVKEFWSIQVSKSTIKKVVKEFGMTWKRMKRGLNGAPFDWEYELKLSKLLSLKILDEKGEIDLRYLDEVGFSLTPVIPYGWQLPGETITLKSSRSPRLNVIGLLNTRNELFSKIYQDKLTSSGLIEFLDDFCKTLTKKTVVVMDQASIHTSDAVIKKLDSWQAAGLEIFWLPPYSPQLNLIEILWKFMKYEWIQVDAYQNWSSLVTYVRKIIDGIGTEYAINFA